MTRVGSYCMISSIALLGCWQAPDAPTTEQRERPNANGQDDSLVDTTRMFVAGSHRSQYAIDHEPPYGLVLRSIVDAPDGFGTAMTYADVSRLRGKRVQLVAKVKTADVTSWAGLWMRYDTPDRTSVLLDNMYDRPITGSRGWREYAVVLDVPGAASKLPFGVLLNGSGEVEIRNVRLVAVGAEVEPTKRLPVTEAPPKP